ncbi:protein phosphatase 2C domain-containing protein [Thermodesulfobacteriota bacterium]
MVVVEASGITDVGQKRKGNEDALYLDDALGLYVVADGMGGHQAGEVASEIVIETVRDYIKDPDEGDGQELIEPDEAISREANRLLSSIHLANQGVHQVAQTNEAYKGMGSTISAAYFTDDSLIVANVGDSPIYLVHDGNIELLSVTHNVISEQSAVDPEAAKRISKKLGQLLTRAMGIEDSVKPDVCEIQCFKGDMLVISSDGLSDLVSPEEILEVVNEKRTEEACQTLVDMANERGGHDNITVIVLKVKDIAKKRRGILGSLSRGLRSLFRL